MRALSAPTIVAALEHMVDIADHRAGAPARARRLDTSPLRADRRVAE
jgi:DNA repair protein RadA/Sms